MDKNKNRTDLLAAGRKKLQQFRQKKDGKGSSSVAKSSRKSNKSEPLEPDPDEASSAVKPTVSLQVSEEETPVSELSVSQSAESSLPSGLDSAAVVSSIEPLTSATGDFETILTHNAELPHKMAECDVDSSVPNGGEISQSSDRQVNTVMPSSTSDIPVFEGETEHDDALQPSASINITEGTTDKLNVAGVDEERGQDVHLSQDDFADRSLSQARGDQEALVLGLKQFDRGGETEFKADCGVPLFEHYAEALAEAPSEVMNLKKPYGEAEQVIGRDDVSVSSSVVSSAQPDGALAVSSHLTNKEVEDINSYAHVEVKKMYEDNDDKKLVAQQYFQHSSFVSQDESREKSLQGATMSDLTLLLGQNDSRVRLSQLVELIRGLDEDGYRLLLNSQQVVSLENVGFESVKSSCNPDLFESLKEELHLTSFEKDVFCLQLSEQSDMQMESDRHCHQLVDEISLLRSSINEVREKNTCLEEDLTQCRFQLQDFASAREELQNQFHTAQAQVEEFSSRANELQISLVRSQEDFSRLLSELADYKNQVATFQVDNENLNRTIYLLTEERNTLAEKNKSFLHGNEKLAAELARYENLVVTFQEETEQMNATLASMTEDKKILDEKLLSHHENEHLLAELSYGKSLIAALQGEHFELRKKFAVLTEKSAKLEEEKEILVCEKEKAFLQLEDYKGLGAALEVEKSNFEKNFALVREEKKKLEEDKEYVVCENGRLGSELLVIQEQLSAKCEENMRLEDELKEVTDRLEHLMEENSFLNTSLDLHKAKIVETNSRETLDINTIQSLDVDSSIHENVTDSAQSSIPLKKDEISAVGLEKCLLGDVVGGPSHILLEKALYDDSSAFLVLKGHLEDAERIFENVEKAFEQLHSHSAFLQRSNSKLSAPGVSKLIQAFESNVHHDEPEVEEKDLTEYQSVADSFTSTKEVAENFRAVLKLLGVDANNASVLYRGERECRKSAEMAFMELSAQHEALKEYCDNIEAINIELEVFYEVKKQHTSATETKNNKLEVILEALQQQESRLKSENTELGEKLNEYQLKVTALQSQFSDLQKKSNEMASALNQQLESSQKEAAERILMLELGWKSTLTQIVETVRRLDESVGRVSNSAFSNNSDDVIDANSQVATSVSSAINIIQHLQEKLEATRAELDAVSSSCEEVNEKYIDLLRKNELMAGILNDLHTDLKKLIDSCVLVGESEINSDVENMPDPLDYGKYKSFIEQLENILGERIQLQSVNDQLTLELKNRTTDFEDMSKVPLDSNAIQKLIEHIENVAKLEDYETDSGNTLASRLELLVSLIVKKYEDVGQQLSNCRQEFGSKVMELTETEERVHQLDALRLQHELEILTLKESLSQQEEALVTARHELQEKISELEQSEQRISSVREKLSIAVAKGKGLVVQRDGLKQSLAVASAELERCSQELQLKDVQLHELEIKLKTYSEAGERVEALESELSYIRNSATALRESFLLKDSVLQRIEEILEDLDLPEHFHSRDIIEKVDWLAKSNTGNPLPPPDWDQKSSVVGSYSDAGYVTVDTWKEDAQPSSSTEEDFRRKYEDLQSKFYGLAEQNEMLEQSLTERNHLVQKWEELLDRIDIPAQLRSMEPEERIQWLGGALSEANHDRSSLQEKIYELENYSGTITADLEAYAKRISDLETNLQSITHERGHLSERLETLFSDNHDLAAKAAQFELENEKLQNKVSGLQEELLKRIEEGECLLKMEYEIQRLQDLVCDVLQVSEAKDLVSGGSSIARFEDLLKLLIEKYISCNPVKEDIFNVEMDQIKLRDQILDEARSREALTSQEDVVSLKKELEQALHELMQVREERDEYSGQHQSLLVEVQALERKREELQELLNQEEQKSASVREKLNVAVRKGKSLVQQRDSLRKTIEELNAELEHLKSELSHRENTIADYDVKIRDLSTYPERIEALEANNLFLKNHLTENERALEDKAHILSRVLASIANIGVGIEIDNSDPMERLGQIEKICHDLHAAVASSEQESRKSKRAAELLLAELNEVQERNDGLQEDLAKVGGELTEVLKERDMAEAAKVEVLSRLEKLSAVYLEDKRKQYSELMILQSSVKELSKGFNDFHNLLSDVSSKDLELLQNLEVNIKSCLEEDYSLNEAGSPYDTSCNLEYKNFQSMDTWSVANIEDPMHENAMVEVCSLTSHHLRELSMEVSELKEKLILHSKSLQERGQSVWKILGILHRERTSWKESFEAMRRNIIHIESVGKEKQLEIVVLRRNVSLLYEACGNSVFEIENRKAELFGNNLATADLGNNKPVTLADGGLPLNGQNGDLSEEHIKTMADKLLSTVKEFSSLKAEITEGSQREMKMTIANLRKELQEKDIQKDRICMELVGQIKLAEAAATNYSQDLQSSKASVHDLEKEVEGMREEHNSLQQKVKELQNAQVNMVELQDTVRSMTAALSSKDQEIEALMQALDEEEAQMEELTKKTEELEKVLQQKNAELENLEASRGKVMKKLSITVSKFDELHNLSESLLAEVEQLQSQLQERDSEISFLRQEVTRCTNDVLAASQMSNKRNSDEVYELLTWLEAIFSHFGVHGLPFDTRSCQVPEYKEIIQKRISSIISELEDLRGVAQSKDDLLQVERTKVEELKFREEILKNTLREKESQLNLLEGGDEGSAASLKSEIVEVEPLVNKRVGATSTASQVRSLRKVNNDQIAISIDTDNGSNRLEDEDEDEDKVHGFKSLTTSRVVPKFTRPVTDMIDGLWVSCDRALMRQPALRLGIIMYWAVVHMMLAAFVF